MLDHATNRHLQISEGAGPSGWMWSRLFHKERTKGAPGCDVFAY